MTKELEELAAASLAAGRSREQLSGTLEAVQSHFQDRLTPSALANRAWTGVRERGSDIADEAAEAVKARPVAVAGAVTALALFLARGRIASAASRLWARTRSRNGEDD